jgi:hypothetical protein
LQNVLDLKQQRRQEKKPLGLKQQKRQEKKPLDLKQQKRQERWYALFGAMFMDMRNLSGTGNLEYYYPYCVYKKFFV